MMKGLTLTQLAAKIEANKALKQDYIVDTAAMTMQVQDDKTVVLEIPAKEPSPHPLDLPITSLPMLPLAHNQLGSRLKIPAAYYDRMLVQAPDLLATNVNAWFRKEPEKRMLRTLGGDVRAFLSNRYNRIENEEIAEIVLPILADIPDVQIVSSEVTERRMYIQAVAPRVQGEVKKGDVVQAGVVISNSEVGCGAVSVAAMDWRLWCLNGAVAAEKFRAYHVGRHIEDNAALWADDTRHADDRAVLLKVRDMVRAAVDATRFRSRIEKMQGLTEIVVTGNPAAAVEILAKKIGASENETGSILRSLIEGNDLSAWGLLNAVTHQAHTAKSYDRAVEFEAAGGHLLELPRNQWREVLEAA